MRVVYFTAGTTGAGHLVRGLAIARGLTRAGYHGAFTMVGPRTPFDFLASAVAVEHRGVTIDHVELLDPARAGASELGRALDELAPDLLIVDMFWGPLTRLLPRAGTEAWLLVRRAPPRWLVGHPQMPFSEEPYARIFAIEPGLERGEPLEPIVIANPDEVRPRAALRDRLGVANDDSLTVIAQVGAPGEWRKLVDGHGPVHVFTLERESTAPVPSGVTVHAGDELFPLASWLAGADAIVAGAGYNAFWEARFLGHAARTRFASFARPIDDQAWRIAHCAGHTPMSNGADVLARMIIGATR